MINKDTMLSINTECNNEKEYIQLLQKELQENTESHMKQRYKNSDQSRNYLNQSREDKQFAIGDFVTLKNFTIAQIEGGALKQKYLGPYRIIHINDDPKTCVLEHLNSNTIRRAHITHLRQFVPGKVPNNLTKIPNNNEAIKVLKQYQGHTYNLRPRLQNT